MTAAVAVAAGARAAVAADAAALAAADTASGRIPGDACQRAATVAHAHEATVLSCNASRAESRVIVSTTIGPLTITRQARAGLPPQLPVPDEE